MFQRLPLNSRGVSLITLMVFVLISSIVAMASLKMIANHFNAYASLSLKGDLEGIRHSVLNAISCEETLAQAPHCKDGELINLLSAHKQILVKSDGNTAFGRWIVRAVCKQNGIELQAALGSVEPQTAQATFVPEPLTKRIYDWNAPKLLMPAGMSLCSQTKKPASPEDQPVQVTGKVIVQKGNLVQMVGSEDCRPSLDRERPTPYNMHWYGEVRCPSGFIAVGGGGNCQIPYPVTKPDPNGGVMLTSGALFDERQQSIGWQVDCCATKTEKQEYENGIHVICQQIAE